MATRRPKFDEVINGTRVRVYATRAEYEVMFGDGDIADLSSEVYLYPKVGYPSMWAKQAIAEFGPKPQEASNE